jgi:hypothetical protein
MSENRSARARILIARVVSEKIPQAERWSVPQEFKSWVDGVSDEDFKVYMDRLSALTRHLSDKDYSRKPESYQRQGVSADKIETKERLELIGGEATAYFALALWRALEAEELVRQLND